MKRFVVAFGLFFFAAAHSSAQGLVFDDSTIYESIPSKRLFSSLNAKKLPPKVDLSRYVPSVMNQGEFSTCVGVSVGYYLRTMLEAIRQNETDKSVINSLRFSPSYLYNAIKEEGTAECDMGTQIVKAFDHLRNDGIVSYEEQSYPSCQVDASLTPSDESKILDYQILFDLSRDGENKVLLTKKALAEDTPVVIGFQTTPSLQELGFWKSIWLRILKFFGKDDDEDNSYSLWKPEKSDRLEGGHAICLTGYDDTKYGGAFRAVNSYGKNWGDAGFFWIRYTDYFKFTKYGFQAFVATKSSESTAELAGELMIEITTGNEAVPFLRNDPTSVSGVDSSNKHVSYFLHDTQPTGTKYRVRVNVTQQAYVYVIAENSKERFTTKLFPEGFETQPPIGKNTIVQLPTDSTYFRLIPPTGIEYFLVLFSTRPIEDIDTYVDEIMDGDGGSFIERIDTAFGDQLVPRKQINFAERKMGFELKKEHTGKIVPLILAIEHTANTFLF